MYPMHYSHNPEDFTVVWESEGPAGTRHVSGTARFVPTGASACQLLYETCIALPAALPDWARAAQLDRPVAELCEAFRRWAEIQ